jgi:hypothetical protein
VRVRKVVNRRGVNVVIAATVDERGSSTGGASSRQRIVQRSRAGAGRRGAGEKKGERDD